MKRTPVLKYAPIRKAVFPVAGLGTRFLPATKASPKEILPVVDKPLIQYAVEETIAAGVTELIFVTGGGAACFPVGNFPLRRRGGRGDPVDGCHCAPAAARTRPCL